LDLFGFGRRQHGRVDLDERERSRGYKEPEHILIPDGEEKELGKFCRFNFNLMFLWRWNIKLLNYSHCGSIIAED